MRTFRHLIGGRLVESDTRFDVINPATEAIVAQAPDASMDQLDAAVAAAQAAFAAWSETDPSDRKQLVLAMAAAVSEHRDELVELLIQEQGKPVSNATGEVAATSYFAATTASLDLTDEVIRSEGPMRVEMCFRPMGVVGAIAPWNYPLLLGYWKVFAALVTGNCVVLKPSPYTPLTTLRAAELFADILPPGVLNVLSGGDELGKRMVTHPGIAKISFTGSTETGKAILAAGAASMKRVTLELGGNDAAIVLPDNDPKQIADKVFWAAFNNSGQICMAIKRLYVHEDIYDSMCDALIEVAGGVSMGEGHGADVRLGPVQNKAQYEKVLEILDEAKNAGATVIDCGKVSRDKGYFVPVTLVRDAKEGMRIVDEEPFGPVLPIIRFSDVDEVINRANTSEYGLGGSIWTKDTAQGAKLAKRLHSGTAWVNQHSVILPDIPFGGHKASGLGHEGALEGLKSFCNMQVVNIAQ